MSVLIEAISVVALRKRVDACYPGGMPAFERDCPNGTFCADEHLARVGFMVPSDVEGFVRVMSSMGLVHLRDGKALDLVVIDQLRGPTAHCDWIEGGRHPDGYSAAWLADANPGPLAALKGRSIAQSGQMTIVDSGDTSKHLVKLAIGGEIDTLLDLETGREGYVGRVPPPPRNE